VRCTLRLKVAATPQHSAAVRDFAFGEVIPTRLASLHRGSEGVRLRPSKSSRGKDGAMSINSMADAVVRARVAERRQPQSSGEEGGRGGSGGLEPTAGPLPSQGPTSTGGGSAVAQSVKQITDNIPSEVLGTYLVVIGLVASSVASVQWILYAIFVLLAALAVWAATSAKARREGARSNPPPLRMLVAAVSFAVWAAAFPGSVFNTLGWYSPELGSAALVVVAFALGLLAPSFGAD